MFIYKGVLLPYPSNNLVLDLVLLLLFLGVEPLRIFYGWKGNLCEHSLALCVSLLMLLPSVTLAVYFMLLQTFVLLLEFILAAVLLCLHSLHLLMGLFTLSSFSRSQVY
ncbi:transmembrane protein 216 [Aulostomus maculatus]